jgi:hypothetical protein
MNPTSMVGRFGTTLFSFPLPLPDTISQGSQEIEKEDSGLLDKKKNLSLQLS